MGTNRKKIRLGAKARGTLIRLKERQRSQRRREAALLAEEARLEPLFKECDDLMEVARVQERGSPEYQETLSRLLKVAGRMVGAPVLGDLK